MDKDRRYYAILNLLNELAEGHFEYYISKYISGKWDDVNIIMKCLNYLGDDLAAQVITKEYFNQVLNAISYMAFILSTKGRIVDLNEAVGRQLGYSRDDLLGKTIRRLQPSDKPFTDAWLKQVERSQEVSCLDSFFKSADGGRLPVHVTAVLLSERHQTRTNILIIAKDNSPRLQNENIVNI